MLSGVSQTNYPAPPAGETSISYANVIVFVPLSTSAVETINLTSGTTQYFSPAPWSSYQLVNNYLVFAPTGGSNIVSVINLTANSFSTYPIVPTWSSEVVIGNSTAFLPAPSSSGATTELSIINFDTGVETDSIIQNGWTTYSQVSSNFVFTNNSSSGSSVNVINQISGAARFYSILPYASEQVIGDEVAFLPSTNGGNVFLINLTTGNSTQTYIGSWTFENQVGNTLLFTPAPGQGSENYGINLSTGSLTFYYNSNTWATEQVVGNAIAFIGSPGYSSISVLNPDISPTIQNFSIPINWTAYQVIGSNLVFTSPTAYQVSIVDLAGAVSHTVGISNGWVSTQMVDNWLVFVPPSSGGFFSAVNLTNDAEFGSFVNAAATITLVNHNLVFAGNGSTGSVYATDFAAAAVHTYNVNFTWVTEQIVGNYLAFIPAAGSSGGGTMSWIPVTQDAQSTSASVSTCPVYNYLNYKVVNNFVIVISPSNTSIVDLSTNTSRFYYGSFTGTSEIDGNFIALLPTTTGGSVVTVNLATGLSQTAWVLAWTGYKRVGDVLVFVQTGTGYSSATAFNIVTNAVNNFNIGVNWINEEVENSDVLFIGQYAVVKLDLTNLTSQYFSVSNWSSYKIIDDCLLFAPVVPYVQITVVDLIDNTDQIFSNPGNANEIVLGNSVVFVPINSSSFVSVITLPRGSTPAVPLALNNGNSLVLAPNAGTGISVDEFSSISIGIAATLRASAPAGSANRLLLTTPSLFLAGSVNGWTGTIDLNGNDLVVSSGNLATLTSQLASAFASGAWTGLGITNSSAATDASHLTALGVIQNNVDGTTPLYAANSSLGTFDGISPGASAILIKSTYYGDTNVDGKVDASDYSRIDAGYLAHQTGWANGDLNYDGLINGSDYTLIDNAFDSQGASLATQIAKPAVSFAHGGAFVANGWVNTLNEDADANFIKRKQNRKDAVDDLLGSAR